MAVIGLWFMGVRDVCVVAALIGGRRGFVQSVVSSKSAVIRHCLEDPPPDLMAEIRSPVRCPGCGCRIFCVPCRYCSGIKVRKVYTEVQGGGERASRATRHLPGTPGKLAVLQARASAGEPLWHPDDRPLPHALRNDRIRGAELVTKCQLTDDDMWCCPEDEVGPKAWELRGGGRCRET